MATGSNNQPREPLIWQGDKSSAKEVGKGEYYTTNVMDDQTREVLKNAKPLPRPRQGES